MNKRFLESDLAQLLIFVGIVVVLHIVLLFKVLPQIYLDVGPWKIYLFLIPIGIAGLVYISKSHKKDNTSVVQTFMLYTMAKIVGSLLFLSPWLYDKDETSFVMVYQFFGVFFPILLAETIFLVRMLNKTSDNFEKN